MFQFICSYLVQGCWGLCSIFVKCFGACLHLEIVCEGAKVCATREGPLLRLCSLLEKMGMLVFAFCKSEQNKKEKGKLNELHKLSTKTWVLGRGSKRGWTLAKRLSFALRNQKLLLFLMVSKQNTELCSPYWRFWGVQTSQYLNGWLWGSIVLLAFWGFNCLWICCCVFHKGANVLTCVILQRFWPVRFCFVSYVWVWQV